jgi:hypothetical protein
VSSRTGRQSLRHSYRPSSEGTFRVDAPENTPIYAVDRGLEGNVEASQDVA